MEYTNSQILALIREHIHSDRDRRIMLDRLINGITMDTLSEKHELSVSQVKRIVRKNMEILMKHVPK